MKILFYMDSLHSGGKERRLVELIMGLSKLQGYQMRLVLSKKGIHYKQIFSSGIKIHYIERNRFKKDPRIFYKFFKIAKYFKPDIIHVWNYTEAIIAIPTKLILNIPMINSQIASSPIEVSRSIFRHKLTFAYSDKILANSFAGLEAYKDVLSKNNFNKCSVIYNGFDFARISRLENKDEVRKKFDITTKFIVAMVASFSYKKDFETFVKAANLALQENLNSTFLCIGSGDSTKYKQMVMLENKSKILFLGGQSNVESIMNICDVGVLITNNETHGEGIPNTLLEFMALGKPVIANSCGGTKELVSDNINGFLIDSRNPKELKDKILLVLNDNQINNKFGEESKNIVKQKFCIKKMIKEFNSVYQN